MLTPLAPLLDQRLARGEPVIIVTISNAIGSTPRDAGATMLVDTTEAHGSIGGGQLEFHAIDIARAMIANSEQQRTLDIPLGPHLGQCCGGRVALSLQRADQTHLAALARQDERIDQTAPQALIFGAGHTGRALVRMLALLPAKTTLIDDRDDVFADLPQSIATLRLDDPAIAIADAPPSSAFVILTHSHALDYALTDAALRRNDASYVGMIGSTTKRIRFEKWFLQRGGSRDQLSRLTCPIGGAALRDKRPEIIAALTTADITRALFSQSRQPVQMEDRNGRAA